MPRQPAPHAADAVVAVMVSGVRTGLRASGLVVRTMRAVSALAPPPASWQSPRLRTLAETGYQERVRGAEELSRLLRRIVPVVVGAVLDQIDLPRLIRDHVDINGIVAQLDIEGIVRQLDLAGLTQQVMVEVDLPELIRESTTSVASETVRDVRIRSIEADQLVSKLMDRATHFWRPAGGPGNGAEQIDRHDG